MIHHGALADLARTADDLYEAPRFPQTPQQFRRLRADMKQITHYIE